MIGRTGFSALVNPPHRVVALQRLLARREHQAFLAELRLVMTDATPSQRDYLAALGGEGLHLLLDDAPTPELLAAYSSLAIAGQIHAPLEALLALHEQLPSGDLAAFVARLKQPPRLNREQPSSKPTIQVKRVIQIVDMCYGSYTASDALGIKRSVFRSEQERTFLQALALRFPGLHAFPNYPLDQLADFGKLRNLLDDETLDYGKHCRVDAVLVVPGEGDPVAAFELD